MKSGRINVPAKVLLSAKNGNYKAFEKIVRAYQRPIFAYIMKFIRSEADAHDIMQDCFVKLYLHIKQYDTKKKFSTWLFTITQHTIYDWLRKKRYKRELYILDNPENPFRPPDNRHDVHVENIKIDVDDAMTHLKTDQKELLLLYYWHGYHYSEIADMVRRPINTVKTQLRRARQALHDVMDNH